MQDQEQQQLAPGPPDPRVRVQGSSAGTWATRVCRLKELCTRLTERRLTDVSHERLSLALLRLTGGVVAAGSAISAMAGEDCERGEQAMI
ncbi:uncharacterized protein IUM83_02487 [Phytophthora cinnamomi]|uniref:uncharacterized protein n=1 Tax=Phytophthora cinnamomi TaxID=4785 RepID=UPI00355ABD60|nr:hypothetical protein IUM83_02487 [Phytophthora cinnamomi]